MNELPDIRRAAPADARALGDILGDAFSEDPCMNWVIPRPALYPDFFRYMATGLYLRYDLVFMDSDERAAAMWLPPRVAHRLPLGPTKLWLIFRLILRSGLRILPRLEEAQEVMTAHHPRDPHYYLQSIGVRRDSQGLGLGSLLLKHMTARCDAEHMPAYLESSSPKNVPLYQRHGFEITGEMPITSGGPPLVFMWREPRQGTSA
jgi:ribosomal protein S18 acetylase RimI-like enzyme